MQSPPPVTTARIDLTALRHNMSIVRDLAQGRAVLAAVKANAYGHSAVLIAQELERGGMCDLLGVATVAEGWHLRRHGIAMDIFKLSHCFEDELPSALAARLQLTVVDRLTIEQAAAVAASMGTVARVHLKLDTGMGRIGARPDEAIGLARLARSSPHLELVGLFTHLPSADTPKGADFTRAELDGFDETARQVQDAVGPIKWVHAANSAGLINHGLGSSTLVRPGIMIYGLNPSAGLDVEPDLRPVLSWETRLSFIKEVSAGTTIGYGRTWSAPTSRWIGTIPVGYGDGFSRLNSNRGHVLIGGRRYAIVGRVCMDQTMIDLGTEKPDFEVGEPVVLIGKQGDEEITTDELAELMDSISYEVTCLITDRVPRITG